jgi:hypothetical protein
MKKFQYPAPYPTIPGTHDGLTGKAFAAPVGPAKPAMEVADDFMTKYVPAYAASAHTARVDMADFFRQTQR